MALTTETIDRICEYSKESTLDAVRELRFAWPMGLKEAADLFRRHRGDVGSLRQELLKMANLTEGMVFENSAIRIELKTTNVPFAEVQTFLIQALGTMYPALSFEELQNFCMNIIWHLKGRLTTEEIEEISENFSEKFIPKAGLR